MKKIALLTALSALCILSSCGGGAPRTAQDKPMMMYADSTRNGNPYSKDPHVVYFQGRYLLYHSTPPKTGEEDKGWAVGVAESKDLVNWTSLGAIAPGGPAEARGFCAPCARVIDGKVHLFYQSYGGGRNDAICHAVSDDGINFVSDPTNPIYAPEESDWSCGRAIDAEVIKFKGKWFLYFATRDPEYKIQQQGVAVADGDTDFSRGQWKTACDESILKPELPWEQECIEGASVIERKGKLYMFYAGAYNNKPQQIGVAVSDDGIKWERLSDEPLLRNGEPGSWNSSESGHPHIFEAPDGRTYLFYQGNNDNGKTWYLSQVEVKWKKGLPYISR